MVEIIITLVVIGITGSMLFEFMNTTIPISGEPARWVEQEASMGRLLEDITADYIHDVNAVSIGSDFSAFTSSFRSTALAAATGTGMTVHADVVCFNSSGVLAASCATEAVPLVRVVVEDPNGRKYPVLFAQTRVPSDPQDAR